MSKLDPVETIESNERIIKKQNREIKKLERDLQSAQDILVEYKKGHKLKLLEIQKRIKEQSQTIRGLKRETSLEVRQREELNIEHQQKTQTTESKLNDLLAKIELLQIENEELLNQITENNVMSFEKDNEISTLKGNLKKLQEEVEHIKQEELNNLQQKIRIKEDLLEKQNQAVNQLTLDIKKYEVEIAELEFKLSNEQGRHGELTELQKKVEKQEEIIIHLRKTNRSYEDQINSLREKLNDSNKRINSLIEKMKSDISLAEKKITYFQIDVPDDF